MPAPAFTAAFAAELATLATERTVTPDPTEPLGFGRDLSCTTDLAHDYGEIDPQSYKGIAEAVIRRLITPRGALLDDQSYGTDVRAFLNRAATAEQLQSYGVLVRNEARKDDRVLECDVAIAQPRLDTLKLTLTITPASPLSTFTFTLAVTADGTELLTTLPGNA